MIKKHGNKFCVVKKSGSVIKCFSNKQKALSMDRAIILSKRKHK